MVRPRTELSSSAYTSVFLGNKAKAIQVRRENDAVWYFLSLHIRAGQRSAGCINRLNHLTNVLLIMAMLKLFPSSIVTLR